MGLDMLETIKEQIASFGTVFQAKANQWLEGWVMKIGELIWQICVVVVFHKRNICRNSYCNWSDNFWIIRIAGMERCVDSMGGEICKCFAISIYRFFCITAAFQLVKYGVRMDIKILETATSSSEAFWAYSSSSVVTALYHFVCLMVGGIALKFVPELGTSDYTLLLLVMQPRNYYQEWKVRLPVQPLNQLV